MFQLEVTACFSELLNTCFSVWAKIESWIQGDPSNPQQDFASVGHHSDVLITMIVGMAVQLYVQSHLG